MNILEKATAKSNSIVQNIIDHEPINYIEAGLQYQIVLMGRFQASIITTLYNHAEDPELRVLLKDARDALVERTVKMSEDFLRSEDVKLPTIQFPERSLEEYQDIPDHLHFSDMEIALLLLEMSASSQMALLTAINQSYHLEIGNRLRKELNIGFDWAYQLEQLMLQRNWLPKIAKIVH
ncbi:hypothetical protein [Dehalobacter sp. TBBPA1]|uniref:hypothetical protein n=1 Tax=Dehalobacter sp. TBBPA1 TaxID=3235037 RepID=UPI0034A37B3A